MKVASLTASASVMPVARRSKLYSRLPLLPRNAKRTASRSTSPRCLTSLKLREPVGEGTHRHCASNMGTSCWARVGARRLDGHAQAVARVVGSEALMDFDALEVAVVVTQLKLEVLAGLGHLLHLAKL